MKLCCMRDRRPVAQVCGTQAVSCNGMLMHHGVQIVRKAVRACHSRILVAVRLFVTPASGLPTHDLCGEITWSVFLKAF